MAVGGQDVICVKQKHSSKVSPADLRRHLENLGDFLFQDLRSPSQQQPNTSTEAKQKVIKYIYCPLSSIIYTNIMQLDILVILTYQVTTILCDYIFVTY